MDGNNKTLFGTVKWFNRDKGYGFIVPEDGGADVFIHERGLEKSGIHPDDFTERLTVSYELHEFKGKVSAGNVKLGPFLGKR